MQLATDTRTVAAMSCSVSGIALAHKESVPVVPGVEFGLAGQHYLGVFGTEQLVRAQCGIEFQHVFCS